MARLQSPPIRLRLRHAVLFVVLLAGAGFSLSRAAAVDLGSVLGACLFGAAAALLLQLTVGGLWDYATEYRRSGGAWTDLPFLAPLAVGLLVAAAVVVAAPPFESLDLWTGLWAGFWAFVVAAAVTYVFVWFRLGLSEGRA